MYQVSPQPEEMRFFLWSQLHSYRSNLANGRKDRLYDSLWLRRGVLGHTPWVHKVLSSQCGGCSWTYNRFPGTKETEAVRRFHAPWVETVFCHDGRGLSCSGHGKINAPECPLTWLSNKTLCTEINFIFWLLVLTFSEDVVSADVAPLFSGIFHSCCNGSWGNPQGLHCAFYAVTEEIKRRNLVLRYILFNLH